MMPKILKTLMAFSLAFIGLNLLWLTLQQNASSAKTPADNHPFLSSMPPFRPAQSAVDITVAEIVVSGLTCPVQVIHAGDNSGRLFVVEQVGTIKIISDSAILGTDFLDVSGLISGPGGCTGSERGLLGLAFHPNYATNGEFYINYTDSGGDTVIARYNVSTDPNIADGGSAQTVLPVDQTFSNHNGGQLLFGPDGYLYIGMGDGGSSNDPLSDAQDPTSLLGKMLRINVTGVPTYTIPADNPFVTNAAVRDEIWAIGLRNPWRFSFDRTTGDLFIGDVGQFDWEEISYQPAGVGGLNFGWPCWEALHVGDEVARPPCNDSNYTGTLTAPIVEYAQSDGGNAVTGGFRYRGSQYPALVGRYFYADYGFGKIWSIEQTGPSSWSMPDLELDESFAISAFGEDEAGELYVVEYHPSNGRIRRLQDANGATPNLNTSTKRVSTPHADPGERITYTLKIHNSNGPSGHTIQLRDVIPAGLSYVSGSLNATQGTPDASQNPTLQWSGALTPNATVTITYAVDVTGLVTGTLINNAHLSGGGSTPFTLTNAVFVPRPVLTTTQSDFFFPGTQPNSLTDAIPDPATCDFCHTDPIYNTWRGSMMAQSGRDPLFWAALTVANNDAPNAGEYCLRCHTPKGWLEGRSAQPDGTSLQSLDVQAGVACEVCHRMVDPVPSSNDEAVARDAAIRAALPATATLPASHVSSGMMIIDPEDQRRGPFAFDPDPPHPRQTLQTDFLGQTVSPVTESRLCGTCHNVDNPVLSWDSNRNQFWPNEVNLAAPSFANGDLFPIERTYDEWANSTYATTGVVAPQFAGAKSNGIVQSCQDCHLKRSTGFGADADKGGINRDCSPSNGCLPAHDLVGGNTWVPQILQDTRWRLNSSQDAVHLNNAIIRAREMLQNAATMTVTLQENGGNKVTTVRVYNKSGHKLPTGYVEGRRMWLNVRAYDQSDGLIYESGVYDPDTGVLTEDNAIKIYEAKQGITPELAAVLNQPTGESFHFVLNNTILKDNRIPPRGYTQATFDKPGLRPVGATYADGQYWDDTAYTVPAATERVVATLYYQTASKEYIDFLRSNGGVDGVTLGALWDDSKSPPEVMVSASSDGVPIYFPLIFKN